MKFPVKSVTIFLLAALYLGCSDDESFVELYEADGTYVKSESDLKNYECNLDRKGIVVYLSDGNGTMVCDGKDWKDYKEWQASSEESSSSTQSSSSAKSSSSEKKGSSSSSAGNVESVLKFADLPKCDSSYWYKVIYVESLELNVKCTNKTAWREEHLLVVRDTLSDFPECDSTLEGAEFYHRGEREGFICHDGAWMDRDEWPLGEEFDDKIDVWDWMILDHDVSSIIKDARDSILEKCTSDKEGVFIRDTTVEYSKNGYYQCSEGHWYVVPDSVADTVGLKPLGEGSFAIARFTKDDKGYPPKLPASCIVSGEPQFVYYVYDSGAWRRASYVEMCQLHPCLKSNEGEVYSLLGYRYRCENHAWVQDSLRYIDKDDVFNKDVEYSILKDDRDGKEYKTVVIDGKNWMAENLNYSDGSEYMQAHSVCYVEDGEDCGIGGRGYTWMTLTGIDTAYATVAVPDSLMEFPYRGICPSGWHVPDTNEWKTLINHYDMASLISDAGWIIAWKSVAESPVNTTGFSALPLDYDMSREAHYYMRNDIGLFCAANPMQDIRASAIMFWMADRRLTYMNRQQHICFVRCVQDGE